MPSDVTPAVYTVLFLDGVYHERDAELVWQQLGHLKTREVGEVLEHVVRRIEKALRRRGVFAGNGSVRPYR